MKSLFKASFLVLGMSISAFATDLVPKNTNGNMTLPEYAGASSCEITSSTGTAAVLCATGAGIILDVFASSMATTDPIVFRDSATANTSSTVLLSVDKNSLDKARRVFPKFKNGLSVNALVAPTAPGVGSRPNWTIVYTKQVS